MTEAVQSPENLQERYLGFHTTAEARRRLKKRYARERRFRFYGVAAILASLGVLALLLGTVVSNGYTAFVQTHIELEVPLEASVIDPQDTGEWETMRRADYQGMAEEALYALFPEVETAAEQRQLRRFLSVGAGSLLRDYVEANRDAVGGTVSLRLPVQGDIDQLHKGAIDPADPRSRVGEEAYRWYQSLVERDLISTPFNWRLFTGGDSREPELAGLKGAIVGSFYLMVVTLAISFPLGIGAAIYLEEFAPKNRLTDLIEVNINNLAAVPSIIFGLLGLAVFIQVFGLPRSAPLVGGLVLSLMTLPTIIIAARASLRSVPPSIRQAALGLGASRMQAIFHHVLPLALPGILTGTIIGLAQALGETAPLLMIGMNAFVTDAPSSVTSASAALPVQVYMWSDSPQRGFVERTSAAIMILLGFLIVMNAAAIWLRRRFEMRW